MLFLSDGRPSDHFNRKGFDYQKEILTTVSEICTKFSSRLTFGAFGFAHDDGNKFELMKKMVEEAQARDCKGLFSSGLDT
jgi:hypothetical protein